MRVSQELNVSPFDALLLGVRLAAGRVAWVDGQLEEAVRASDGERANAEVRALLKESRHERNLMARTAKAAIDAGVAERLVRQVELEGRLVAEIIGRVLDRLELAPEQRTQAFTFAHQELLQLEEGETAVGEP